MSFLIKICGVTLPEDAALAATLGAGAIGVNFWRGSKRFVGEAAAQVLAAVPEGVLKFGVFVNAGVNEVVDHVERFGLHRAQLHGDERPEDFRALPPAVLVRAVRVRDAASLEDSDRWATDLLLLDAFVDGYGGAGTRAPWAAIAAARPARPFLLAGGLDADNVRRAIATTRPAGVDVASGVERTTGRKDRARLAAFIVAAREAGAELELAGPSWPSRGGSTLG